MAPAVAQSRNGPPLSAGLKVYLDFGATTPVDQRVRERMAPFLDELFGNPSSREHAYGWDASEAIDEARAHVAALVGAEPADVVFTSGATESINTAFKGLAWSRFPRNRAIISSIEHDAVAGVCRQLERIAAWEIDTLGFDACMQPDLRAWTRSIESATQPIVSLIWANSEIGTLHPVAAVADLAHQNPGAVMFSDVTHAVGRVPIDLRSAGVDLAAFSAHKIYGPKGVGALVIRGRAASLGLEPLIAGGSQERGRRAGTSNVAGIVGFGEACRIAAAELADEHARLGPLRDALEHIITSQLDDCWINAAGAARVASTSSIGFRGVAADQLIREMRSVAVSSRSACSSGAAEPSRVLKALGLTDEDAFSCVRFTLGRYSTAEDVGYAADVVIRTVRRLRRSAHVRV